MLTRYEMEEILNQHDDGTGSGLYDDVFFNEMTDEEVWNLFIEIYPDEKDRQALEKSNRSTQD